MTVNIEDSIGVQLQNSNSLMDCCRQGLPSAQTTTAKAKRVKNAYKGIFVVKSTNRTTSS